MAFFSGGGERGRGETFSAGGGRWSFEAGQRGSLVSQINVTPLVDVMLVLLVIFMVTAPIIQQGVEVNIPKVRAMALKGEEQQFVVSITRDKQLYLNDTRMSDDELTQKLTAISAERPGSTSLHPRR